MDFKPTTGKLEAFTISLSTMAPTLAMSFTTPLAAQGAGRAVPLAFLAGGIAIAVVAYSFIAFSRRIIGAGSAMAYVDTVFGKRAAFLTGWTMLLSYLAFTAGSIGMVGNFTTQALTHFHIGDGLPIRAVVGSVAGLTVPWIASRRLSTLAHLMLLLEFVSAIAVSWLAVTILWHRPVSGAPFTLDRVKGLPGLGSAMVFSILAFAGFETATTLSEETIDAKRAIPLALVLAILMVTAFFVLVSYAQVVGYGAGGGSALAKASAPLDELSSRYIGGGFGVFLDLAAAISAFACALGTTTAAARLFYALGEGGLDVRLTSLNARHQVPRNAVLLVAGITVLLLLVGLLMGGEAFAGNVLTIGTLALIMIYVMVCGSQVVFAARIGSGRPALLGGLGTALLLWPLYASIYPIPSWPANMWPVVVLAWIGTGILLLMFHSGVRSTIVRT